MEFFMPPQPYYGKPVFENWLDEIGMTDTMECKPLSEGDEVRYIATSKHKKWMLDLVGEIINVSNDMVTVMWHNDNGYSHFGTYNVSELIKNENPSLYI